MTRKRLIWIAVALAAALLVWVSLAPDPVVVETATVGRGPLRVTVNEEGETRLKRRFMISAPVSGRVLRIDTRPGDAVKAGQIVAVIQPSAPMPLDARTLAAAEARVRGARASTDRARAERDRLAVELKQAEADAARARALLDTGYGTREAVEQLQARVRGLIEAINAAESAARGAEFELAEARAALISRDDASSGRATSVTAPIDGLVLKRLQESEAVVQAGTPLLEVGNLDDLEIVADLLSTDAVKVSAGDPVVIDRWGGEGTLDGRVQRVEPSGFMKISALGVEEQRVNVVVDFVAPRAERATIGDGYRVEVRIVVWEKADAVTVPTSSLFRAGDDWAVFVVEGDVVRRRAVRIGERNEQAAEVIEGLSAGDRVVAYPGESLADGVKVRGQ